MTKPNLADRSHNLELEATAKAFTPDKSLIAYIFL
jgi:hypothetical protein